MEISRMASNPGGLLLSLCCLLVPGCAGSGAWSAEPSPEYDDSIAGSFTPPAAKRPNVAEHYRVRRIGATQPENPVKQPEVVEERLAIAGGSGRVLGTFRNTYYDFPAESDFGGETTPLFDAGCQPIAQVKTQFHDQLCVQGSGLLSSGSTVSFAKRDCGCARVCPKTQQQICYESLDKRKFPWGRGAQGTAITPLLTVAVDSDVVGLGAALYIPEYEGLPIEPGSTTVHDGCFIAEDRGLKVKGKHVDIFTGDPVITRFWNRQVPSNKGVTVVLEAPQCARARRD
jgi:3D (Asp-Asp-Asp) domain-containing protein